MNDTPTSPVNDSEIEAIFGDGPPVREDRLPARSLRAEWVRFARFLKRPNLESEPIVEAPMRVLLRIYALDFLCMFALIMAASIAVAAGIYLPETALAGIEFTPLVILAVIVGAPVMEELIFRGWLSGKLGHILALASLLLGVLGFGIGHVVHPLIGIGAVLAGLVGAGAALVYLNKRPPMRWFAALFPGFFWLSTLAFALVHLANFEEGALAILLPLVLPQFILGMMLGYVRVRIGLWAAIVLHGLHNAGALALAGLASLAQG